MNKVNIKKDMTPSEINAQINLALEDITRNNFGNPIIFQATPTNATMKANTWGKFSNSLYIRFADGVTLKIDGTVI